MKLIFEAIEAQLQAQKNEILFKDLKIEGLQEKLAAAETENKRLEAALHDAKEKLGYYTQVKRAEE